FGRMPAGLCRRFSWFTVLPVNRRLGRGKPSASVAQSMQIKDCHGSYQTVDAEEIPAAALEPLAQPFQREKPGEKRQGRAQQARECRRSQRSGAHDALG